MTTIVARVVLCGLAALMGSGWMPLVRGAEPRPNLVFIYTDDQARWAVGAYGNREARTPHLDRLAREGALAREAFTVTPVCSPSRASLMTGLYPTRLKIDDWIDPRTEPDLGLDASFVVWPEVLRDAGYATMLLGKWHLGTRPEFHPRRQGFDEFYGFLGGGSTPRNPTLEVEGREKVVTGSLPDLLVDRGIAFIEAHRDRPFLLSVHFREPHAPYGPVPEADSAAVSDVEPRVPDVEGLPVARVKGLLRDYYASVHSVDRNVGRLLETLDRLDLASNTIVVATSDHGYMIGHHGLWHKGNGSWIVRGKSGPRPNMFDDSIRVPLLVRWPSRIKAGKLVDRPVTNLDVFPTILELTGVGMPSNLRIDGRSFAPDLLDRSSPPGRRAIFGQYDMHHYRVARMRMIRADGWKLIRHFEPGGQDELYNLVNDPDETRNLIAAADHAGKRRELSQQLDRFLIEHRDPLAPQVAAP